MKTQKTRTVADIVTENIKTAHIFRKYNIDFCCGGGISIQKAAEKAKINFNELQKELSEVNNPISLIKNYNQWELNELADHIVNVHHKYIRENIPVIIGYASRVVQVYAKDHPELIQIQRLFSELSIDLTGHLKKEEKIVFPFIKSMTEALKKDEQLVKPAFDTLNNPIRIMEEDHEEAGVMFKKIKILSNYFTPPAGACNTFNAFYSKLEEFEKDLHHHVHLENNILFPKALEMEKQLF